MQLSPFTEQENIITNIEATSEPNLQKAVFYLDKLKRNKSNRFALFVPVEMINKIFEELESGRINDFNNKLIVFITSQRLSSENDYIRPRTKYDVNFPELAVSDLIFIEDSYFSTEDLPETHAILLKDDWEQSKHGFRHNFYQQKHHFSYRERRDAKTISDSFEIVKIINDYFNNKENSWAREIAWRLDRENQQRYKEKSGGINPGEIYETLGIKNLLPKSDYDKTEAGINLISAMAFPSIIESLVCGIKGRKPKTDKNGNEIKTTISEGFDERDLEKRRTKLVFQHRMHSEISKDPRKLFYSETALNDLKSPEHIDVLRKWDYDRYTNKKRSVWIDVKGKDDKNLNEKEIDMLIKELKMFLDFAKSNPGPDGKKWSVACLAFYDAQTEGIRERRRNLPEKEYVNIKALNVDKFQGHESDIVFLSMVRNKKVGFMDNPNRLNVALTRAKFQLVIIGNYDFFLNQKNSPELKELAKAHKEALIK